MDCRESTQFLTKNLQRIQIIKEESREEERIGEEI